MAGRVWDRSVWDGHDDLAEAAKGPYDDEFYRALVAAFRRKGLIQPGGDIVETGSGRIVGDTAVFSVRFGAHSGSMIYDGVRRTIALADGFDDLRSYFPHGVVS